MLRSLNRTKEYVQKQIIMKPKILGIPKIMSYPLRLPLTSYKIHFDNLSATFEILDTLNFRNFHGSEMLRENRGFRCI